MIIKTIKFLGSFTALKNCPKVVRPEYAFIGRSNVGKSSLINMVAGIEGLARISSTPGKTQHLNYFDVDEKWCIVDLPGYGFAKTPAHVRQSFKKMTDEYLLKRENLQCAFLLIDSCVPPQEADLAFADWMGENQIPFVIVFTKTDKKKSQKKDKFLTDFKNSMLQSWDEFPTYFITSSEKKTGRAEILNFIENINKAFYEKAEDIKTKSS
jgi:GTP-binding protein